MTTNLTKPLAAAAAVAPAVEAGGGSGGDERTPLAAERSDLRSNGSTQSREAADSPARVAAAAVSAAAAYVSTLVSGNRTRVLSDLRAYGYMYLDLFLPPPPAQDSGGANPSMALSNQSGTTRRSGGEPPSGTTFTTTPSVVASPSPCPYVPDERKDDFIRKVMTVRDAYHMPNVVLFVGEDDIKVGTDGWVRAWLCRRAEQWTREQEEREERYQRRQQEDTSSSAPPSLPNDGERVGLVGGGFTTSTRIMNATVTSHHPPSPPPPPTRHDDPPPLAVCPRNPWTHRERRFMKFSRFLWHRVTLGVYFLALILSAALYIVYFSMTTTPEVAREWKYPLTDGAHGINMLIIIFSILYATQWRSDLMWLLIKQWSTQYILILELFYIAASAYRDVSNFDAVAKALNTTDLLSHVGTALMVIFVDSLDIVDGDGQERGWWVRGGGVESGGNISIALEEEPPYTPTLTTTTMAPGTLEATTAASGASPSGRASFAPPGLPPLAPRPILPKPPRRHEASPQCRRRIRGIFYAVYSLQMGTWFTVWVIQQVFNVNSSLISTDLWNYHSSRLVFAFSLMVHLGYFAVRGLIKKKSQQELAGGGGAPANVSPRESSLAAGCGAASTTSEQDEMERRQRRERSVHEFESRYDEVDMPLLSMEPIAVVVTRKAKTDTRARGSPNVSGGSIPPARSNVSQASDSERTFLPRMQKQTSSKGGGSGSSKKRRTAAATGVDNTTTVSVSFWDSDAAGRQATEDVGAASAPPLEESFTVMSRNPSDVLGPGASSSGGAAATVVEAPEYDEGEEEVAIEYRRGFDASRTNFYSQSMIPNSAMGFSFPRASYRGSAGAGLRKSNNNSYNGASNQHPSNNNYNNNDNHRSSVGNSINNNATEDCDCLVYQYPAASDTLYDVHVPVEDLCRSENPTGVFPAQYGRRFLPGGIDTATNDARMNTKLLLLSSRHAFDDIPESYCPPLPRPILPTTAPTPGRYGMTQRRRCTVARLCPVGSLMMWRIDRLVLHAISENCGDRATYSTQTLLNRHPALYFLSFVGAIMTLLTLSYRQIQVLASPQNGLSRLKCNYGIPLMFNIIAFFFIVPFVCIDAIKQLYKRPDFLVTLLQFFLGVLGHNLFFAIKYIDYDHDRVVINATVPGGGGGGSGGGGGTSTISPSVGVLLGGGAGGSNFIFDATTNTNFSITNTTTIFNVTTTTTAIPEGIPIAHQAFLGIVFLGYVFGAVAATAGVSCVEAICPGMYGRWKGVFLLFVSGVLTLSIQAMIHDGVDSVEGAAQHQFMQWLYGASQNFMLIAAVSYFCQAVVFLVGRYVTAVTHGVREVIDDRDYRQPSSSVGGSSVSAASSLGGDTGQLADEDGRWVTVMVSIPHGFAW